MQRNDTMSINQIQLASYPGFFQYGAMGIGFARDVKANATKNQRILHPYLARSKSLKTGKIRSYAARITSFFGKFVEYLTDRELSDEEYRNLCLSGALTPVYDRYCDDLRYGRDELEKITFDPSAYVCSDPYYNLYTGMLDDLRNNVGDTGLFNDACRRVMEAQLNSRKQSDHIAYDLINTLTREKGGASFLFCASTLHRKFDDKQNELFSHLGGFIQIIDDIFDVEEDLLHGVSTIPTYYLNDVDKMDLTMEQYMQDSFEVLKGMDITEKRKKKLQNLYYLLAVTAKVYLKRLKAGSHAQDLLDGSGKLSEKYAWKGWTPGSFASLVRFLVSKR